MIFTPFTTSRDVGHSRHHPKLFFSLTDLVGESRSRSEKAEYKWDFCEILNAAPSEAGPDLMKPS